MDGNRTLEKITALEKQISILVEYMQNKIILADWHAVADAAMDIRELEAKIRVYKDLTK